MNAASPLIPSNLSAAPYVGAKGNGGLLLTILTAVLVVLYVCNIHDHFYLRGSTVKPLYVQFLTIGVAVVALLARPNFIIHNYPKSLLAWMAAFTCLVLVSFMISSQSEPAVDQLVLGIKTVALLFAFVVLLMLESNSRLIMSILVAAVLFSVAMNIYDFVSPTYSSSVGRAAGFFENANVSGKVISISMVLSCAAVPRRFRLAYCLAVGLGVLVTFSRSSWLLWTIGFTGLAATGQMFRRVKMGAAVVVGSLGLLTIYLLLSGAALEFFRLAGIDEYLTSGTIARLGGTGDAFQDASAIGRTEAIWFSLSEFAKNPWFGAGLGATNEWMTMHRPHNLYLTYAVEAGVFGLVILLTLLRVLWSLANPIGRVIVILYAVSSVFTHNNLEQGVVLCLIAMALVFYPKRSWEWGSWNTVANSHPHSSEVRIIPHTPASR